MFFLFSGSQVSLGLYCWRLAGLKAHTSSSFNYLPSSLYCTPNPHPAPATSCWVCVGLMDDLRQPTTREGLVPQLKFPILRPKGQVSNTVATSELLSWSPVAEAEEKQVTKDRYDPEDAQCPGPVKQSWERQTWSPLTAVVQRKPWIHTHRRLQTGPLKLQWTDLWLLP